MIQTVANLLEEIQRKGKELIKKYEIIDHPVLIGDMYEGLTQEILDASLFSGLDLKIVSGKIKNSKNILSDEIDCMLVEGVGDPIPFTEKFIYHHHQVIAVIQVKKSLHTNALDDSYTNLRSVIEISEPDEDSQPYLHNIIRDAYRALLGMELPKHSELHLCTHMEQQLYHSLVMEAYFPLRIVFGFFGFKSEYNLREGFVKMLEKKVVTGPSRGYGPISMPNLIICGENCIVKSNGMPFGMRFLDEEYYWPLYVSSPHDSLRILLEVVWTRLSYKYSISSSIFGKDFGPEQMHRYLDCKLGTYGNNQIGWEYNYCHFNKAELRQAAVQMQEWAPSFLSQEQFTIVQLVIRYGEIDLAEADIQSLINGWGHEFHTFIDSLVQTGLLYERNGILRLLTDQCTAVVLPDGRFAVGENKNGEFSNWIDGYIKSRV